MFEIKKLPKSEAEITGEIPADEFERAFSKALTELNQKTGIPGFRPGHVPESVLIEKVGEAAILEEAAEIALREAYPKMLEENKIEAIGQPEITITKIARKNPLGFKIKTAVLPEITLPDYKKIAGEAMTAKEEAKVEEKEIDDALEFLKKSQKKDENPPAGGELELNDEFAKNLGQKDLLGLRELLRENILSEKEQKAREQKRMEILEKISSASKLELPEILVESEKEKMLAELKSSIENMGLEWQKYLGHVQKTEDLLRKEWAAEAGKRASYALILREIANAEKIEPTEKEINAEAEKMTARLHAHDKNNIDTERLKDYAYGIIRNEKVFQLLETPN